MLPHLTLQTTGKIVSPKCQYGTITLKNGMTLKWRSSWLGNIVFFDDKAEQLYSTDFSYLDTFFRNMFAYIAIVVFIIFLAGFEFNIRNKPYIRSVKIYTAVSNSVIGKTVLRAVIPAVFFYLAYLLLVEPAMEITDGVLYVSGGRGSNPHVVFSDSEPVDFWFWMFLESLVPLLAIGVGLIILILNPKSEFWYGKQKTVIAKTTFLATGRNE